MPAGPPGPPLPEEELPPAGPAAGPPPGPGEDEEGDDKPLGPFAATGSREGEGGGRRAAREMLVRMSWSSASRRDRTAGQRGSYHLITHSRHRSPPAASEDDGMPPAEEAGAIWCRWGGDGGGPAAAHAPDTTTSPRVSAQRYRLCSEAASRPLLSWVEGQGEITTTRPTHTSCGHTRSQEEEEEEELSPVPLMLTISLNDTG